MTPWLQPCYQGCQVGLFLGFFSFTWPHLKLVDLKLFVSPFDHFWPFHTENFSLKKDRVTIPFLRQHVCAFLVINAISVIKFLINFVFVIKAIFVINAILYM